MCGSGLLLMRVNDDTTFIVQHSENPLARHAEQKANLVNRAI